MTTKPPTMDEIQQRTSEDLSKAYEKQPRMWPLFPSASYNGDVEGVKHTTQERMTSGDLGDAPDDGGPLALGKGSNEVPFKGMRSGR